MRSTNQKIVFASGPSRSGTTLLQLVLSSHPEIHITPETKFTKILLKLSKKPSNREGFDKKSILTLKHSIANDPFLSTWPYPIQNKLLKYINQNKTNINASDVYSYLLKTPEKESEKCLYIGNKQETFVDGYGIVTKKIFPSAKFIIIVRDPRDVTKSVMNSFSKKHKRGIVKSAATTFSASKYIDQLTLHYPNDVFILRYEDLVLSPKATCKNICDYLKIGYDKKMINFHKRNKSGELLIGDTKNIHQNLTSSFNKDLVNQWQKNNYFNSSDLLTIEYINKNYMTKYNYKRFSKDNITLKVFAYIVFVFLRFQYKYIKYKYL